jgi:hypothetical protein
MKITVLAALLGFSVITMPALAQDSSDASVTKRLNALGIKYEIDNESDFKITYSYTKENRTQLVFVSNRAESIKGFTVREIYSPAARVEKDRINGDKALMLLEESRGNKLGSWEIKSDVLYFVIKMPETIEAKQLEALMDIAAESADDMELELTGRDDL